MDTFVLTTLGRVGGGTAIDLLLVIRVVVPDKWRYPIGCGGGIK